MKYIIEIEDEPFVRESCLHGEEAFYRAKGFKSLVFDDYGLSKLKPYREDESWELAREILNDYTTMGYFAFISKYQIDDDCREHLLKVVFDKPIAKVKQLIKQHNEEIKIGDEVIASFGHDEPFVVTTLYDECVYGVDASGALRGCSRRESDFKKTGRHFDSVEQLFKDMKEQ